MRRDLDWGVTVGVGWGLFVGVIALMGACCYILGTALRKEDYVMAVTALGSFVGLIWACYTLQTTLRELYKEDT